MAKPRTKRPPAPKPVEVDVKSLTHFAFNAGLTIESMEALILGAPDADCQIRDCVCVSADCNGNTTRHLVALRGFDDRDLIYCENCGQADIWV